MQYFSFCLKESRKNITLKLLLQMGYFSPMRTVTKFLGIFTNDTEVGHTNFGSKKHITKYIILSQIHQPLSVPQGIITDTVGT